MPPTSSPVPRLFSAPSDVFTVHTIASRSPSRHRRTSSQQTAGQRLGLSVILTASPLFCSVFCLHSPHHRQQLTFSRYRKRKGKDGHPVRFWEMSSPHLATPRHRLTISNRAAPRRSAILPAASSSSSSSSSPPSGGEVGKSKGANRTGREREPVRRVTPPSSPVPLFCMLPSPSTPSPVLPFRLRLRFLLFFALISSARSRLFALPSSCSSFLVLLPAD